MGLFRNKNTSGESAAKPIGETFTIGGHKVTVTTYHNISSAITVESSASEKDAGNILELIIAHLKHHNYAFTYGRQEGTAHRVTLDPNVNADFLRQKQASFEAIVKECAELMQKAPDKEKAEAMLEEYNRIAHGQETSWADQSAARAEQEAEQKSLPYRAAVMAFLHKNRPDLDVDPDHVRHFQEKTLVMPVNRYGEYKPTQEITENYILLTDAFCTGAGQPLNDDEKKELSNFITESLRRQSRGRS